MSAPTAPRPLADLPYAEHLEGCDEQPVRDGDYDTVHFEGVEFADADGEGARFLETAFSSVTFTQGTYQRARFHDVWLHTVRWAGTDLGETDWLDAEITASALAGVLLCGGQLRRVTFHHCTFNAVNARATALREVTFVDCLLREVDFGDATLTDVTFPGSTLERVRFTNARLQNVDLRGATDLEVSDGVEGLNGATITGAQLLDLAPLLADALGIDVTDH